MTCLYLFDETAPDGQPERHAEPDAIRAALAPLGVSFERWPPRALPATDAASVLAAYSPEIESMKASFGYQSADVVRMVPDHPQREVARAKFLAEHQHDDDETRFFVQGAGMFYLRGSGRVCALRCEAGDLIRVPAATRHWFDMGTSPQFIAIRLFTTAEGWVATFTGDDIARRFPSFDALAGA